MVGDANRDGKMEGDYGGGDRRSQSFAGCAGLRREALRLLLSERAQPMLLVTSAGEGLEGIVTKTDILEALRLRDEEETRESWLTL
ncbi:MAG: hypothetical protein WAL95_09090 [Candidatus Acidiferrales bacterium]